jgi:3-oxoacyl-[acyl-carrier protein] reductase
VKLGLDDKVALVCGGSRGCGFGIARELAREGAAVAISGRQPEIVADAVSRIQAEGGRAAGIVAPMTDAAGAALIVSAARRAFGDPDILVVNTPGVPHAHNFAEASDANFDATHEEWVTTYVGLIRLVLPHMRSRKWGRVVNIASVGVKTLHLKDPMYFSNMRIEAVAITKTLAHEFGREGITANVIATGPFQTERSRNYMKAAAARQEDEMIRDTAVGRWGQPEEMGAVVAFLCSTRASFVTGETIRVDGGYGHSLF